MKTKDILLTLTIGTIALLLIRRNSNVGKLPIIGGYFTSWSGSVSILPLDKITHINYAFVDPNDIGDGSMQQIPDHRFNHLLICCIV